MRFVLSLVAMLLCWSLVPAKGNAAEVNLLQGVTGVYSTWFSANLGTTPNATDGNVSTSATLQPWDVATGSPSGSTRDAIYFTIPTTRVTALKVTTGADPQFDVQFYNGNTQIASRQPNGNGEIFYFAPVNGVNKIVIANYRTVSLNVFEIEAYNDTTPPAVPSGLHAVGGDEQVSLTWNAVSDAGPMRYNVYRDGQKVTSTPISAASYVNTGLVNGSMYSYEVTAVDSANNESAKSSAVMGMPFAPDDEAPASPSGLAAMAGDKVVNLSWDENIEPDVASYRLYRNETLYKSNLTGLTYSDTAVTNDVTYTYAVTAMDPSGNESEPSMPVQATPTAVPIPLSVNFIPNKDSIVVQVVGGQRPYTIDWGEGTDTFDASQYSITGLMPDTDYIVTVTDDKGETVTETVNTGDLKGFVPPTMPNPVDIFQRMIDNFGSAGSIAIAIIGAAVALGLIVLLGIWGWRLMKRWLATAK